MKRLNRQLFEEGFKFPEDVEIGKVGEMPERIIQFGEGNFLRAFVDWMVDVINEKELFNGSVVVVQPIPQGLIPVLNEQEGLYTLMLRGIQNGEIVEKKRVVTSISRGIDPYKEWDKFLECATNPDLRFIVSNTTEAGIAYVEEERPTDQCPTSFPAKVTAFLYERYKHFEGAADKGMLILPCELIDRNGDQLKEIVLRYADEWGLEPGFKEWIEENNYFFNTLVDRIVTGYPKDEIEEITQQLGYEDKLVDTGEIFHLWVIEGDKRFAEELPFTKAGLNVLWTDDMTPYRTRKVRILNGAHTMTALAAYLYGKDTVRECVEDPVISAYMKKGIFEEVIPVLDLPENEKKEFADAVFERFANPFIRHLLLSISLNSVSKWKVRVLPSLLEYLDQKGELPTVLTFSLAALLAFYRGTEIDSDGLLVGNRGGNTYQVSDNKEIIEFFASLWKEYEADKDVRAIVEKALGREDFWDQDLNKLEGMTDAVTRYLDDIIQNGIASAIKKILE